MKVIAQLNGILLVFVQPKDYEHSVEQLLTTIDTSKESLAFV